MEQKPKFVRVAFAVAHENHPVVRFVQSQANILEQFVNEGVLNLSIEPGEDFDYYVYTYDIRETREVQ